MRRSILPGIILLSIGLVLIPMLIIVSQVVNLGGGQVDATQQMILEHPTNAQVLAAWCGDAPTVTDVIGDTWQLGTHPDLVEHFYRVGQAGAADEVNVKWVVCRRPGLVNSETGIIYGLATGTSGFFLRLPGERDGDKAAEYGPGWTAVDPWSNAIEDQCARAYTASKS